MNAWELRDGLKALVVLLMRTHPAAFRVLLGEYAPPDAGEILSMLASLREGGGRDVRTQGGRAALPEAVRLLEDEERFNEIVDASGGWAHINRVASDWASHYHKSWAVMMDHVQWVDGSFSRIDTAQTLQLRRKHGISKDTVWRYVQEFPAEFARVVLQTPVRAGAAR